MDDQRTEYARSVAERIEQEFLDKLRRFMATSVPLEDIGRVQAEFGATPAAAAHPALRLLAREPVADGRTEPAASI
ncbi:MAG TPA: hypothetical protein VGB66_06240, partial [Longimicrobium sp.]